MKFPINFQRSPLHCAISKEDPKIVKLLLEHKEININFGSIFIFQIL